MWLANMARFMYLSNFMYVPSCQCLWQSDQIGSQKCSYCAMRMEVWVLTKPRTEVIWRKKQTTFSNATQRCHPQMPLNAQLTN